VHKKVLYYTSESQSEPVLKKTKVTLELDSVNLEYIHTLAFYKGKAIKDEMTILVDNHEMEECPGQEKKMHVFFSGIAMTRFQKRVVVLLFVLLFSAPLFGQTAEKLEVLLNEPELSWSQAAAFIIEAADLNTADPESAFRFAVEEKWLSKKLAPDGAARLNGIALLLMRSFDLKGGIFYSISKSPHHAYRELVYKNVIRGNTDPDMPVSGRELLMIVSRILTLKEQP